MALRASSAVEVKPEQDGRIDDPWEGPIRDHVETLSRVCVTDIARLALGFDAFARIGTADQRRIASVLTSLGWRPGRDYKGRFYARAGVEET